MTLEGKSATDRIVSYIEGRSLEPDTLFTYGELTDALGHDVQLNRGPVYAASRRLETKHRRTLVCVPGRGYRLAHPSESADIGVKRIRRSERQVNKGAHTVRHTEIEALDQEARQRLYLVQSGMNALQREMREAKARLSGVERRVDRLEAKPPAASVSEIRELIRETLREMQGG